jgi:hypothetical protein
MPVEESDLVYRLSGGAENTDPDASLGGAMSTEAEGVLTTEVANNLFDDVTGKEGAPGDVEYRGFYVENDHGSLTAQNAEIWIEQDANSADDTTAIALADEAVNSAMETIANESTAPSGPTFSAPTEESPLSIGNIPAGQFKGIWIRRTIAEGAAAKDTVTLKVKVAVETAE